jgi:hypothetical protein
MAAVVMLTFTTGLGFVRIHVWRFDPAGVNIAGVPFALQSVRNFQHQC